jgi:hypothetical protein
MAITQQASKLRPNEGYNTGGSGVRTSFLKFEFKGDFNKVQHLVGSKVASGTPGTYKVQFAVTDAIAMDTISNAYLPVRNGVTYNDRSANGWKDATFGGAASKQIGLAPSQANNSIIHMSTDVMDLASIPRADGQPGSILLVKVTQMDAAGGYTAASNASNTWDSARGKFPWFTEWYSKSVNYDAIADLSRIPGGGPYNEDYTFPGFPIVTNTQSTLPTDLLLFTGDSRKCAAYMAYQYANPARMAAMGLSTPTHPISTVNGAGSGHNQQQFLAVAMDMINAGLRPTVVHVPGFSQNNFSNFATYKTNLDNFMAAVRAVPGLESVKFVLDTDYYVTGYAAGTPAENGRQQCIAYAKSLHNGTTVFCFDSDAIITDYSNPSAPTFKSAYFDFAASPTKFIGGDGVHAGPLGLDAMAYGDGTTPGLQSVYRTAFGISPTSTSPTGTEMPQLQKIPDFAEQVLRGVHNFGAHVFKAALTNTVPAAAAAVLADITQVTGGAYVAGGYVLDAVVLTETAGIAKVAIADEVITASGGAITNFRYAVVYNDTATNKPLIGYIDYGSTITLADGETLTLDFDASAGVLTLA